MASKAKAIVDKPVYQEYLESQEWFLVVAGL